MKKKVTFFLCYLFYLCSHAQTNQWTWVSGDKGVNQRGVYGTKGVADPANKPGGREGAVSWVDGSGTYWLFGGLGGSESYYGFLNDLWKYNPATNQWTWVSGDKGIDQPGVYGTKGVADPANKPGARDGAVSWVDGSGSLWLFGGFGYDESSIDGFLNDLWKYNPATNQWTWVSGDKGTGQPGVYGTKGVADPANKPGPRAEAASWTDAAGKLWLMGGNGYTGMTGGSLNDLWMFNPSTGEWTWINGDNEPDQPGVYGTKGVADPANKPGGRYGTASWVDGSGSLWLFGGQGDGESSFGELNDLWKYNPATNQWTWVSGDKGTGQPGVYGTKGVADPANKPGGREYAVSWVDGSGSLWLFGGSGISESSYADLNDLWQYNSATNQWTWVSGDKSVNQRGVYGIKGVANPANKPGARDGAFGWVDSSGALWLFGGSGYGETPTKGYLNDMWQYGPQQVSSIFYRDGDGDGYGNAQDTVVAAAAPPGYVASSGDCDDSDATIHPGAVEVANGKDDNCNGVIDEGFAQQTFYKDNDKDGYGSAVSLQASTAPPGYVAVSGDCDDRNAAIHPGAVEVANGLDDNCNGVIDEGFALQTFYKDNDKDGYGSAVSLQAAAAPPGYVAVSGDCDDRNAAVHPGAVEVANGLDDNCNGVIDEGFAQQTFYKDNDKDGYGSAVSLQASTAPPGYVAVSGDCDDRNAAIHPGAVEVANGLDDNCNGQVDEVAVAPIAQATAISQEAVVHTFQLTVKAAPNPSPTYFTVQVSGSSAQSLTLRVLDAVGRLKEERLNVVANSSLQLGHHYQAGLYYLEVVQGSERVVVKLVKR